MLSEVLSKVTVLDVGNRLVRLVDGHLERDPLHPVAHRLHLDQLKAVFRRRDPMVHAKHLHGNLLGLRFLLCPSP